MSEQVNIEQVREALRKSYYPTYKVMATWLLQMAVELEALRAIVSDVDMELISETPLSDTHWEQIKLRIDEYATGGNDDDTR